MSGLATTATVKSWLRQLESAGCTIVKDNDAGTATATEGEIRVFWALQKGKNGPWIVRYTDGETIKWNHPPIG